MSPHSPVEGESARWFLCCCSIILVDIGQCFGFTVVLLKQDLQQMLLSTVREGHGMGELLLAAVTLSCWVTPCEPRRKDQGCAMGKNLLAVGNTTGVNQSSGTQSTSPEII